MTVDSHVCQEFCAPCFSSQFALLQTLHHQRMVSKGFYDKVETDAGFIGEISSEISEILQAIRAGNPASLKIPEFSEAEEETADSILRLIDFAEHKGYRVAEALLAKMAFNLTRPERHGKIY